MRQRPIQTPSAYREFKAGKVEYRTDKFGNVHLSIAVRDWQSAVPDSGCTVELTLADGRQVTVEQRDTFGQTPIGVALILPDDDGRPALAVNRGSFASLHGVAVGDDVVVTLVAP